MKPWREWSAYDQEMVRSAFLVVGYCLAVGGAFFLFGAAFAAILAGLALIAFAIWAD